MKVIANNIKIQYNETNQMEIVITVANSRQEALSEISKLKAIIEKGKLLFIEASQYRHKRSLDANSYCWVIISKIADALKTSKEEVYIEMLKRYGQREPKLLSVVSDAVDMIYRATQNHCTEVGESELNGKIFKHLAILIGSSQYDTKQMSILVDGIVSEAKELGIETMTPAEIESLKNSWGTQKAS